MTDLTEFLLARIAEDEAAARASHYDGQVWIPEEEAVVAADRDLDPILYLDRKRDAAHAYRWSPARVLADIAAKRRIVDLHGKHEDMSGFYGEPAGSLLVCYECGPFEDVSFRTHGHGNFPCRTLRALAAPYADHPDYRPEWAPESVSRP